MLLNQMKINIKKKNQDLVSCHLDFFFNLNKNKNNLITHEGVLQY